jgi:methionine transaminase
MFFLSCVCYQFIKQLVNHHINAFYKYKSTLDTIKLEIIPYICIPQTITDYMPHFNGLLGSKLPQTGTSIFAVMSKLALEHKAVNLSQGFPDFPIDEKLIARVNNYMKKGFNQYAPMPGVPELRQAIAARVKLTYGIEYSWQDEINITAGATQALNTAITAFVKENDEVIIFEPAYDSYIPSVKACGGLVKHIGLKAPDFRIEWDEVARCLSNRTRMIIINSPHNPTGTLIDGYDLHRLDSLTRDSDIIVLSDEVYEHLIFDNKKHYSVCELPGLLSRSLVVGSFGKTFHATGWKTGFVLAPANLMEEFRKLHQFVVFASNTPIQYAISDFLGNPANYENLGRFYEQKRDYFVQQLKGSRFEVVPCYGTYFQLLNYKNISDLPEMEFAKWLVQEHKVAAVPISPFYHNKTNQQLLRFCFAKTEKTLDKATQILCRI